MEMRLRAPVTRGYFFLLSALRLVNAASPRNIDQKKISSGTQRYWGHSLPVGISLRTSSGYAILVQATSLPQISMHFSGTLQATRSEKYTGKINHWKNLTLSQLTP